MVPYTTSDDLSVILFCWIELVCTIRLFHRNVNAKCCNRSICVGGHLSVNSAKQVARHLKNVKIVLQGSHDLTIKSHQKGQNLILYLT